MATANNGKGRKYSARTRRLRALRKVKREEAQRIETRKQAAILLKTLSRREIVQAERPASN